MAPKAGKLLVKLSNHAKTILSIGLIGLGGAIYKRICTNKAAETIELYNTEVKH
jgi:hypothetical protein